jgi:3'-phosphoadenosine 5'-phosphosulfate sulfotransferase (PAPS reductase)/FAD synthetase
MSNRFLRDADPAQIVERLVLKGVLERGLIEEGDRVLIACSGGKDSTTLAWALAKIRQIQVNGRKPLPISGSRGTHASLMLSTVSAASWT